LSEVEGGKLYHGSASNLEPGTLLEPGHGKNFKQSASDAVSITSDYERARYWARKAAKKGEGFVYEVAPQGDVVAHSANLGKNIVLMEGRVRAAKITAVMSLPKTRQGV
jgi:hypothetical protein